VGSSSGSAERQAIELSLIAEDADWATDAALAISALPPDQQGVLSFCLVPDWCRIVHESLTYLRARTPALPLQLDYAHHIAACRHSVKLFDDSGRSAADLVDWFERVATSHRSAFQSLVRWHWVRLFALDLGISRMDDHLIMTTHVAPYRAGLQPDAIRDSAAAGQAMFDMAREAGAVLGDLVRALRSRTPVRRLDLSHLPAIFDVDYKGRRYFGKRFDPSIRLGLKEVLTAIEASANIGSNVLTATSSGHEEAVFRARLINAAHVVSTLKQLRDNFFSNVNASHIAPVHDLLSGEHVDLIASPEVRRLRNVSMHYGIDPGAAVIDTSRPMWGLVESLVPGQDLASLSQTVSHVLRQVADCLAVW